MPSAAVGQQFIDRADQFSIAEWLLQIPRVATGVVAARNRGRADDHARNSIPGGTPRRYCVVGMQNDEVRSFRGSVDAVRCVGANPLDGEAARFEHGFENLFGFRQTVDHNDALSACHSRILPWSAGESVRLDRWELFEATGRWNMARPCATNRAVLEVDDHWQSTAKLSRVRLKGGRIARSPQRVKSKFTRANRAESVAASAPSQPLSCLVPVGKL